MTAAPPPQLPGRSMTRRVRLRGVTFEQIDPVRDRWRIVQDVDESAPDPTEIANNPTTTGAPT